MTLEGATTFIRLIPDPAVLVSSSGRILARNEQFAGLLEKESARETDLLTFVEDDPQHVQDFLRMCARTRPSVIGSLSLRSASRSERYVCEGGLLRPRQEAEEAWVLLRFRHAPEAINSFQVLNAKIAELNAEILKRRRAEAELREMHQTLERRVVERTYELEQAIKALKRSNRALEDFAYVASHDLSEPLRKIRVFGDILEEELSDFLTQESRSILGRMRIAAERMQRLIQGLLNYSRISTRANPLTRIDLNEVVCNVLTDLELAISERNASVEVGDLPSVVADPLQMQQLFQNILSNCLKFARVGVPLQIGIECEQIDESAYEIRITDNGIGFEEQFSEKIFEPFQRLHSSHLYDGSGMGLAICRKIVERHQGQLVAEGRPDEGATFRILLPINTRRKLEETSAPDFVGVSDFRPSA